MSRRDESGFTLIELLLAVMLMGVIVAAVSGALIVMFTTTTETTERLSESPDLQIAAAYFGSDGQSATAFNQSCGTHPAGSTVAVSFSWTDPGTDAATPTGDTGRKVSYVVESAGNQKQLVRYACVVPASGAETVERTMVVNYVRPSTTPVASCTPSPCGTTTKTVELPVTICTADASLACRNDPLDFTLRATRRTT